MANQKQKLDYGKLKHSGERAVCAKCGTEHIRYTIPEPWFDGDTMYWYYICTKCRFRGAEQYTLTFGANIQRT